MEREIQVRPGDVMLLVGTRKGSFVLTSDERRTKWSMAGPYSAGADVFHMTYDPRTGALLSAVNNTVWGPEIQRSEDLGKTWLSGGSGSQFEMAGDSTVKRVWHVEPGPESEPGVLYAGAEPASLLKSEDGGVTWREVEGLTAHPSRDSWRPGLGGLCLHSIVVDPSSSDRMWVGISAVGVFRTENGGKSWTPTNKGVRADFLPEPFPELGQCTHKLLAHGRTPGVLVQQNHCGVFRSDSGGDQWLDVSEGLPSRFGMPLGLHSTDPDTLYVVPEDRGTTENVGGGLRYVSDARLRVFRSRDGGKEWEPLTNGLPQTNAYLHVMREGMATDSFERCGIYLGTTTGQIFYSRDDGESWGLLTEYLPPINSVECAVVA